MSCLKGSCPFVRQHCSTATGVGVATYTLMLTKTPAPILKPNLHKSALHHAILDHTHRQYGCLNGRVNSAVLQFDKIMFLVPKQCTGNLGCFPQGKRTAIDIVRRHPVVFKCAVFLCFCNPLNSDMDYRIFNMRIWSFVCVRIHTEVGHTDEPMS